MNTNFKKTIVLLLILVMAIGLTAETKKPNPKLSFLMSAIIPGTGELSQKHTSGYFFLSNEFALIFSKYYLNEESDIKLKNARLYALKKAEMSNNIHSEEDLIRVGKYSSSGFETGGYNEHIVIEAKNLYPDSPLNQSNYIAENQLSEEYYWNWDNSNSQKKYRVMRKRSAELTDYAKSISGFFILNHAISAFNAARVTKKNKLTLGMDLNIENKPLLTCQYNF